MTIKRRIIDNSNKNNPFPITVNCDKTGKTIDGLRYYFTCQNCKNQSWYDERYCNNGYFYYTSKTGVKTEKVYCKNYEVTTK